MANYEWEPIAYNEAEPVFTFSTDESDIAQNLQNTNNIQEFTDYAKNRYKWYVNRLTTVSNAKRLVNLWYYYNFLTWAGYDYYPKCVLASLAWLVSGISSPWEGQTVYYYTWADPQNIQHTPGYLLPQDYTTPCGNAYWGNVHQLLIYTKTLERIYLDTGQTDPNMKLYNSETGNRTTTGFGICQWTNWTQLLYGARMSSNDYGDGLNNPLSWARNYPYNVSLQCFILNHARELNDEGHIASSNSDYAWIKWQQIPDPDLMWTPTNPRYDCFEMSWSQFMSNYTLTYAVGKTLSQNWLANDEGKFKLTARQWQALFNNVGRPISLIQDEQLRYNNYVHIIKPCFEYWDAHEKVHVLNMPEPFGTWNDPWHKAQRNREGGAVLLLMLLKRRNFPYV